MQPDSTKMYTNRQPFRPKPDKHEGLDCDAAQSSPPPLVIMSGSGQTGTGFPAFAEA